MRVEVAVSSGRRNPAWSLSDAEGREFADRLTRLAAAIADQAPLDPALGYRGTLVSAEARDQLQFASAHLFAGDVVVEGATPMRKVDPNRSLELWALRTGEAHLDPDFYQEILTWTSAADT